jgi:hypothetical protein
MDSWSMDWIIEVMLVGRKISFFKEITQTQMMKILLRSSKILKSRQTSKMSQSEALAMEQTMFV